MPLLDHFHPPLYPRHRWHGFHNAWATYLAADLNRALPPGYFAEPNVQFSLEIDTAVLREAAVAYTVTPLASTAGVSGSHESIAWQPPSPTQTIPFALVGDTAEVLVYEEASGPTLVGAIELVSPANKDRPAQRSAFTAKCEYFLRTGIGLLVVDVVTTYKANLHHALLQRLHRNANRQAGEDTLYTTAYYPVERGSETALDFWYQALTLGQDLPTMPLWLRGGPCMPVALEATYQRTCQEQRITVDPM
ncbi:MAG: DUF4058 family protein [Caldilinea sp. CFX5]|nr:DUF4058 family protein [Caldilinea sp. CFX5]